MEEITNQFCCTDIIVEIQNEKYSRTINQLVYTGSCYNTNVEARLQNRIHREDRPSRDPLLITGSFHPFSRLVRRLRLLLSQYFLICFA